MEIKSLGGIPFTEIHKAFTRAFIDYELPPMSIDQLRQMLSRRGLKQELSMGAFVDGEIVSFTLNGIDQWDGMLTAYDTGTATIKEYRGQGLARKIFNETVPVLKEAGVAQYLLEVLQHNEKAVNLYKGLGFEVIREFDYFSTEIENLKVNSRINLDVEIRKLEIPSLEEIETFWDFKPAWQNSLDSINRTPHSFLAFGAYLKEELIGYGITEFDSGDITQLSVKRAFRRKGVGTALLRQLIELIPIATLKVINTDSSELSMLRFLKSVNLEISGKQFEMIKAL